MSSNSKKQKTEFVPGFRNGVGRPLAHGSDSAKSRKETTRRRNESQIYLLHAHAEWVAERATWALEHGRPVNNADFAKHLLTDHAHRCSPQYVCSVATQTEPSDLPISCQLPTASTALTSTPIKGHRSSALMPFCPRQVALPLVEEPIDSLDESQTDDEEEDITWEEAVKRLHESGLPGDGLLEVNCSVDEKIFQLEEDDDDEKEEEDNDHDYNYCSDDNDNDNDGTSENIDTQLNSIAGIKAVVWVDRIMELLQELNGRVCKQAFCKRELQYITKFHGSAFSVKWKCTEKYHPCGSWCSQPQLRGMYTGNLEIAAGIVLSGNSLAKMQHFFKCSNIKGISRDTFFRVQKLYVAPAVNEMWASMQESLLNSLKDSDVVVSGDARNDSPGHCAQYSTYTMMDERSGKVLHMEMVDVREAAGKSSNMEKIGFTRCMDYLTEKIKVKEVVTDGHLQIAALMKNAAKYEGIEHQNDLWHGSKTLTKMIMKAAKSKENKVLIEWMPAIRNHFWYSSRMCNGDEKALKATLLGMLHHIVNQHEWSLGPYGFPGKCAHEELDEQHDKAWLTKGSPAHKTLGKLLTSKRFMKKLRYFKNFRHTGNLESFHNHLLMYVPKRHSYRYVGFSLRSKLAAIDNNYHADRKHSVTKDGRPRYRCNYSKRTRNFYAEPVAEAKTYGYMPDLMRNIAAKRLTTPGHVSQHVSLAQEDPQKIHPRASMLPRSSLSVLIEKHLSRFAGDQ